MASSQAPKRASHSMEAVLTQAVALLDEAGESALTFRALASRLGGGVASIYWYVANKEELLDRAADHVMAGVMADISGTTTSATSAAGADPIDNIRTIAITLFDAVEPRPWLGAYFMRNTAVQLNTMAYFETLGQQTQALNLTPKQRFHAVSTVIGFVVGTAADLGQRQLPADVVDGVATRDEYLAMWADRWRALDAAKFPFMRSIADEFASHDDAEQFRAGLDLILEGLRLQAGA